MHWCHSYIDECGRNNAWRLFLFSRTVYHFRIPKHQVCWWFLVKLLGPFVERPQDIKMLKSSMKSEHFTGFWSTLVILFMSMLNKGWAQSSPVGFRSVFHKEYRNNYLVSPGERVLIRNVLWIRVSSFEGNRKVPVMECAKYFVTPSQPKAFIRFKNVIR